MAPQSHKVLLLIRQMAAQIHRPNLQAEMFALGYKPSGNGSEPYLCNRRVEPNQLPVYSSKQFFTKVLSSVVYVCMYVGTYNYNKHMHDRAPFFILGVNIFSRDGNYYAASRPLALLFSPTCRS